MPAGENIDEQKTLEFGVSGFLINSVVVLYDRTDNGLWSQLLGEAISGPLSGHMLRQIDSEILSWKEFREKYPDAKIVGYYDTGFPNKYASTPYGNLADDNFFVVKVPGMGTKLRPKELGLGIRAGDREIFITRKAALEGPVDVETDLGVVRVRASDAGVYAEEVPEGVIAAQTFYFGWSAFFPETEIIDSGGDS